MIQIRGGPEGADNKIFNGCAEAQAEEPKKSGAEVIVYTVDLTDKDQDNNSIEDALNKKLPEDNKGNVDRVHIFGHGASNGSLKLPYNPHTNDVPKGSENWLGNAAQAPGTSLKDLAQPRQEAIKKLAEKLKEILSKDGGVVFYGCWNGVKGGIADLISQAGVMAQGYTDLVDYPAETEKGTIVGYKPPRPAKNSELVTYEPVPVEIFPEGILSSSSFKDRQ